MFNQSNHIWPITTLVRITPIQWTNQSFPRRIKFGAGAKGGKGRGKSRRALSKIGSSFASDWLKRKSVYSLVRRPCPVKFASTLLSKALFTWPQVAFYLGLNHLAQRVIKINTWVCQFAIAFLPIKNWNHGLESWQTKNLDSITEWWEVLMYKRKKNTKQHGYLTASTNLGWLLAHCYM